MTGIRTVITKARSTMAVVTLEDLQGTLEVVVFPKTYEQTIGTWREGAILLVAGRVDHRGEEASLLADAVWDWDAVAERGPEAFAREVGRARPARRRAARRAGPAATAGYAQRQRSAARTGAVAAGRAAGAPAPSGRRRRVRRVRVSPTRAGPTPDLPQHRARRSRSRPTRSRRTSPRSSLAAGGGAPRSRRSPTRQRNVAAAAAQAPSASRSTPRPGAVLNVRFARDAGPDRVVSAMQAFKAVLRERPGGTRVVVHVPAPGGSALPMELRGVAYDAELLAEVRRRVGEGVIDISLG